MSRTRRKAPQGVGIRWCSHELDRWYGLYLSFVRSQRPGKDAREAARSGGWYDWLEIPGRRCRYQKRWAKRHAAKMRRRVAKEQLQLGVW
jgi:hypothetical protein